MSGNREIIIGTAPNHVQESCLVDCNSLRDIPAEDLDARRVRLEKIFSRGCMLACGGSIPGLGPRICGLSNSTKGVAEELVAGNAIVEEASNILRMSDSQLDTV